MTLQQLYAWSKKIHNWSMWLAVIFGIPLAISGLLLHKIVEGEGGWIPIDPAIVRWAHGQVSNPFALVLAVMMVTGMMMWGVPKLLRLKSANLVKDQAEKTENNQQITKQL